MIPSLSLNIFHQRIKKHDEEMALFIEYFLQREFNLFDS